MAKGGNRGNRPGGTSTQAAVSRDGQAYRVPELADRAAPLVNVGTAAPNFNKRVAYEINAN
jgi:hypothetical protein